MTNPNEKNTGSFPFKTLITVVGILIGLLIFKDAVEDLILNTEELSINGTGVVVRVNKEDAETLKETSKLYESQIDRLKIDLTEQEESINSLNTLNNKLKQEIADCPNSQETSKIISNKIRQIQDKSKVLKNESIEIEKYIPKYSLQNSITKAQVN